ncbi:MAG: cation transporter [Verrucomicrobia bacterium]|nr:cation transporter [Verrucomicrobiota bacterium]
MAGYLAGSVALTGFGLDSLVESLSGAIMIWRFYPHPDLTPELEARKEKRAIKLVGWTFLILAAYVAFESLSKLYFQEIPQPSLPGIIIAAVSILLMPTLFFYKRRVSRSLHSRSLLADARQTLACFFLSVALFLGLGLNYLFGLWQADPITGLLISVVLVKEGYSTLTAGELCSCCG